MTAFMPAACGCHKGAMHVKRDWDGLVLGRHPSIIWVCGSAIDFLRMDYIRILMPRSPQSSLHAIVDLDPPDRRGGR